MDMSRVVQLIKGRKMILIPLVAFAIIVTSVYAMWSGSDINIVNGLCRSCHLMDSAAEQLQGTPHENFRCTRCHNPPLSMYVRGIAVEMGFIRVDMYELQARKMRMEQECTSCHSPVTLQQQAIHVVHFRVISAAKSCTICHSSHDVRPKPSDCLSCHNMQNIRSSHGRFHSYALEQYRRGIIVCGQCHSQQALWEIPIPASAFRASVEGFGCFHCHASLKPVTNVDDCLRCHSR